MHYLARVASVQSPGCKELLITGHSLGGALAAVCVPDLLSDYAANLAALCSAHRLAGKYRLDIDDRRAIDHFYRTNPEPFLAYFSHRHPMQPQRIRPVRRSRCKYSRQCSLRVRPRMDLENLSPPLVQPGDHKKLVSCRRFPQSREPQTNSLPATRPVLLPNPVSALLFDS